MLPNKPNLWPSLTLLQCSQLEAITKSTEYLLATAATGSEPSLNIPFVTRLFESKQNVHTLLCRSKLFDWARAESWGHLSFTRLKRDITSMISESEGDTDRKNVDSLITEGCEVLNVASEDFKAYHSGSDEDVTEGDKAPMLPSNQSQQLHRQLSAKLHCLYGISIDNVRKETTIYPRYSLRSDTAPVHPYARSSVYDLRQHTDHTLWGPFLNDGLQTVDWEKLEAIMVILDHNIKLSADNHHICDGMKVLQDKPFVGATPKSFVSPPSSIPMEPSVPLEMQDPYNVTGTWMRVVCFLDYTELYEFNFDGQPIPDNQPRQPIDTDEAIRLITMKVRVTKIESPGEEDGQGLPVVHFNGHSSSLRPSFDPNGNSKTKGQYYLSVGDQDITDNAYTRHRATYAPRRSEVDNVHGLSWVSTYLCSHTKCTAPP